MISREISGDGKQEIEAQGQRHKAKGPNESVRYQASGKEGIKDKG